MATKTIAWATGSGNITLTYTGQGNGSISVSSSENDSFDDRSQSFSIVTTNGSPEKAISILVKQRGKGYDVGHTFEFDYTGTVQQVTLPKGRYKLQCWGAQGGNVTGTFPATGSKGGYSEGEITLAETTTLYVFVGGKGSNYTSAETLGSSLIIKGGWNGGGAGIGTVSLNYGDTDTRSFPRGGGGATDISTVTSTMSYSSGRTNRSSDSLLARCIVAGGGAGASSYYSVTNTLLSTNWINVGNVSEVIEDDYYLPSDGYGYWYKDYAFPVSGISDGTFKVSWSSSSNLYYIWYRVESADGGVLMYNKQISSGGSFTINASKYPTSSWVHYLRATGEDGTDFKPEISGAVLYKEEKTYSTSTSNGASDGSQQGGGTSGKGQFPGTQTGTPITGGFGYGGNQAAAGTRYASGGGGGGWYGGGTASSSSSLPNYVNYSGGGSGFVNTANNAASRPSGYMGLELDSGTTIDGSLSFESVSGGTETGHTGNGYARITVLQKGSEPVPEYEELLYIESTGTQYIDTEFKPNNNTRVILSAYNLSNSSGWAFGTWKSSTSKQFAFSCNGTYSFRYGTTSKSLSQVPIGEFYVDYDRNNYTINDISGSFTAQTFECEHSMYLFAINANGSVSSGKYTGRIYSCKIYSSGTLVRDYVPVKNSNGVAGLYDKVNNKFYSSKSDTNFLAGSKLYSELEYIESAESQYIDTGFNPSYNTRVVVDIEGLGTSQGFVFGAKDTNSSTAPNQFALYRNSSTKIRADYFGTNKSLSLTDASSRTVIDFNKNVVSLFGSTITNTSVDSGSCTNTLHLFALMSDGSIKYPGAFKMYSCKIYDDDTLIRDYIPAKGYDGVIGLYDKLNNVFYSSASDTNFTGA